jgi:hypothetical protein
MALIGGSVSDAALRTLRGCGGATGMVSAVAVLVFLIDFGTTFTPFTSLKVLILRERLSEGGGDCDISDGEGLGWVRSRNVEVLAVLVAVIFDAKEVREEVREGAFGLGASMEACERLRAGICKCG